VCVDCLAEKKKSKSKYVATVSVRSHDLETAFLALHFNHCPSRSEQAPREVELSRIIGLISEQQLVEHWTGYIVLSSSACSKLFNESLTTIHWRVRDMLMQ
jgi:hypothetical protein